MTRTAQLLYHDFWFANWDIAIKNEPSIYHEGDHAAGPHCRKCQRHVLD